MVASYGAAAVSSGKNCTLLQCAGDCWWRYQQPRPHCEGTVLRKLGSDRKMLLECSDVAIPVNIRNHLHNSAWKNKNKSALHITFIHFSWFPTVWSCESMWIILIIGPGVGPVGPLPLPTRSRSGDVWQLAGWHRRVSWGVLLRWFRHSFEGPIPKWKWLYYIDSNGEQKRQQEGEPLDLVAYFQRKPYFGLGRSFNEALEHVIKTIEVGFTNTIRVQAKKEQWGGVLHVPCSKLG